MKNFIICFVFILVVTNAKSSQQDKILNLTCDDFSWSEVVLLVEPYIDESIHSAIVMQGLSSGYKSSDIATMALDASKPEVIQKILNFLIKAEC